MSVATIVFLAGLSLLAACAQDSDQLSSGGLPSGDFTTGTVKWFRPAEGYGAIITDETPLRDVWVHFSAIPMSGFRLLKAGQRVELRYEHADQDGFKYRACYVRLL